MDEKFTLMEKRNLFVIERTDYRVVEPSFRSIAFIRQFARSYHVEPKLPKGLNTMIIN